MKTPLPDQESFYYPDFAEHQPHLTKANTELSDNDSELSPIDSGMESLPRCSTKMRHASQSYGTIAQHLAMSIVI